MILTGEEIKHRVNMALEFKKNGWEWPKGKPRLLIEPFDERRIGPNSYNFALGDTLKFYTKAMRAMRRRQRYPAHYQGEVFRHIGVDPEEDAFAIDPHTDEETESFVLLPRGTVIFPGMLYLGQTIEWTETDGLMPQIDGRSSYGRFGICFHQTAGKGDIGFHGRWTLEITVPQDTIIRPGEEGVQISYLTVEGDYTPYRGKYQNQSGAVPSRLWKEFQQ